jgi:very-short-patch-repair endonuclease
MDEPESERPLSPGERGRVRGKSPDMQTRARQLRHRASDAELALWYQLRSRRLLGYKFRRQVVIERYIVDFLCVEATLIVEVDGGQHLEQQAYDSKRTEHLESLGYRVVRFLRPPAPAHRILPGRRHRAHQAAGGRRCRGRHARRGRHRPVSNLFAMVKFYRPPGRRDQAHHRRRPLAAQRAGRPAAVPTGAAVPGPAAAT